MLEILTMAAIIAGLAGWLHAAFVGLPALGRERFEMRSLALRDELDRAAVEDGLPICPESARVMMRFIASAESPQIFSLTSIVSMWIAQRGIDEYSVRAIEEPDLADSPITPQQREYLNGLVDEWHKAVADHLIEGSDLAVLLRPARASLRLVRDVVPSAVARPTQLADRLDDSLESADEYELATRRSVEKYPVWLSPRGGMALAS